MDYLSKCPREVRDMIYTYVLVDTSPITPYPTGDELRLHPDRQTITTTATGKRRVQCSKVRFPSPALLRVNKTIGPVNKADPIIYLEARIVLYGKNEWRLTGILPENDIFRSYPQLFRQVMFVFNQDNISPALKRHIWKMYTKQDWPSDEFKATHEQCMMEVLRIPQWPQLLLAFIPHLDLIKFDLRGVCCGVFRSIPDICKQGGMFYNNYLACLKHRKKSDQGMAQKRPGIGLWGSPRDREFIRDILRADDPPESVKQLQQG